MASNISFLPNFPVKFQNIDVSCLDCDTREFCQLAEWPDRFEFAYEPSTTDVSIVNGTFTGSLTGWTNSGGWTYNSNKARLTNSSGQLTQNIYQTIGRKYKVSFNISNFTSDGITYLNVFLGGQFYAVLLGEGVTANGDYSFYVVPTTTGNLGFAAGSGTTITLDLDDVTVELVSEPCGIKLYNVDTGTYSGSFVMPNLSDPLISTLGFSYLWTDFGVLYDGCYQIAMFDTESGSNVVTNGTFTGSAAGWTITGFSSPDGWFWVGNTMGFFLQAGNTITSYFDQNITANLTATPTVYKLRFTTLFGSASGSFPVNIVIAGVETTLATISSSGTIELLTPPISNASATLLRFGGVAFSLGPTIELSWTVDTVTMTAENCTVSDLSECYKIAEDHGCTTKMLTWTNQLTNGFNYPYYYFYAGVYGFQHMRVECDIRSARYPGEASRYTDSGGNDILYNGSVRKNYTMFFAPMPEYMHDALASGLKHKAFFVEGVRSTFQDTDYEPEWGNERLKLAESQISIGQYTQDNYSID